MKIYEDSSRTASERAAALLSEMDLDEKMSQLVGYCPAFWSNDDFDRDYPHGAGQVSMLALAGMDDCYAAARFQTELQKKIMARSRHHIPALFHMEVLCGALVPGAAGFPSGIGRGASFDPELEQDIGALVGAQAVAVGASEAFGPVLDVTRDARFGRHGESYGEDPTLAAAMGTGLSRGLRQGSDREGRGLLTTAKHFLAFHNSLGGIHAATCEIGERQLREIYAKPFQAAITEGGLMGIMPCYNAINGEPVSGSHRILTELLQHEMGFDGLVVADYSAVREIYSRHHVTESPEAAGIRALRAGLHQELPSKCCFNDTLRDMFATGAADMDLLDQAVLRILIMKFKIGLFEQPFAMAPEQLRKVYEAPEGAALSQKSAEEAIVLLKNDGILPMDNRPRKITVIGHHGDSVRSMFGGYTYVALAESKLEAANTMAGLAADETLHQRLAAMERYEGSCVLKEHPQAEDLAKAETPGARSLVAELAAAFDQAQVSYAYGYPYVGNDTSGYGEALESARAADVVIMAVGDKYGMGGSCSTGECIDGTNINLPECQETLLEQVGQLGKPLIVIHFGGRPISSNAADCHASAIIEAWNPAGGGAKAIASVLSGHLNPSGRLPVSVAYGAGQIPVFYNHNNGAGTDQNCGGGIPDYVDCPHAPRYCFGHGLSYTTFTYDGLEVVHPRIHSHETEEIRLTVENTGSCDGTEVVQLYIRDRQASMVRPAKELAGFCRVFLKKGEKKQLTFKLYPGQLAFLDENMRWKVESGDFEVMVGSSSETIHLTGSFSVRKDGYVEGRTRKFWADCNVLSLHR